MDTINDPMFQFWTEFFDVQFKIGENYKGYIYRGCSRFDEWADFNFKHGEDTATASLDYKLGDTVILYNNDKIITDYDGISAVDFLLDLLGYD
jgi:hypothetical protein